MNVEETVKVNRLAKELLEHGIVANSEDALIKAEAMISGRQKPEVKRKEEAKQKQNQELRYLESAIKYLSSEVKGLASSVNKTKEGYARLLAEVDELKKKLDENKAPVNTVNEEVPVENNTGLAPKENNDGKKGFSEEDIAIDKVFYFGKK